MFQFQKENSNSNTKISFFLGQTLSSDINLLLSESQMAALLEIHTESLYHYISSRQFFFLILTF